MTTLAMITMNAGNDIPGSTIKYTLKNFHSFFDRIIVVDGKLTDKAREFYDSISKCEYVDSPWKDSYVDQYRAFADRLENGEWCLYLDCDEMPSETLLTWLKDYKDSDKNIYSLPCILHLTEDGKRYYPSEPNPPKEYKKDMWLKHILFKKEPSLIFQYGGSHVIASHGNNTRGDYLPLPYFHMKSLESFVYNDVWQAYLHPPGQGYSQLESNLFKVYTNKYKTTKEFKEATFKGEWSPVLQKLAAEKAREYSRPISRLAWVYWILLGHPVPSILKKYNIPTEWDEVKDYVLSEDTMKLYHDNIQAGNFFEIEKD